MTLFPPALEQCCGNCRYWRFQDCCRHAPQAALVLDSDGDRRMALWPQTVHDNWCGEWAPKEA